MNDTTIKELAFATGGEIISGNENAVFFILLPSLIMIELL